MVDKNMIEDIDISIDLNNKFINNISNRGIEMRFNILTSGCWPTYNTDKRNLSFLINKHTFHIKSKTNNSFNKSIPYQTKIKSNGTNNEILKLTLNTPNTPSESASKTPNNNVKTYQESDIKTNANNYSENDGIINENDIIIINNIK